MLCLLADMHAQLYEAYKLALLSFMATLPELIYSLTFNASNCWLLIMDHLLLLTDTIRHKYRAAIHM